MPLTIDLILLIFLFIILGISADFVVKNIQYIASIFKIRLFTFGIILGIITTLPELSVGINATIEGASSLSVGNILSGVIVILGLVLGASILLNRQINTDGNSKALIPQALVILSPILLGIDGKYGFIDGIIMISLYAGLIFYLYKSNETYKHQAIKKINKIKILQALVMVILGIVFILTTSNWIVKISLDLLDQINISKLILGSLVFAIGTNLPEITIAITSWRKKASELSLSHLLSSAFTNILVLGILATIKPILFGFNLDFWVISIFLILNMILFLIFYRSNKKIDRKEGFVLLSIYILFILVNFYLINK